MKWWQLILGIILGIGFVFILFILPIQESLSKGDFLPLLITIALIIFGIVILFGKNKKTK